MGSIVRRGTRDNPKYYVKYKDIDGRWKMRLSMQETKDQAKTYLRQVEGRVARGLVGIPEPDDAPLAGVLMDTWEKSLVNRNAKDDRRRYEKHLKPVFAKKRLAEISLPFILDWIDEQRRRKDPKTKKKPAEGSIRHNLNLLSRFFSWAIDHGHTTVNPVRQIPQGKRPQQAQKRDVPWLDDDDVVRKVMAILPSPIDLMFYIGNRSGLRTGEIVGLRISDMQYLDEGVIRARFSYDGPLKEDKKGVGKIKWVPAAADAIDVLGPWLKAREAEKAEPEDLVFPCPTRDGSWYRKEFIEECWEEAAETLKLDLTWYDATRHSFTSRNLELGVSLDEVSAALGHSSPVVTKRYYDHFVRRSFSTVIRSGLAAEKAKKPGSSDEEGSPVDA